MNIRNFVIIAHVDHGKSTLADRFLEITGTIEKRKMREQYLDMHPLEREKGITIKMQPVRMIWRMPNHADNQLLVTGNYQSDSRYILNLIDTPGHVDFTYEVSRALAAVEGAILLVDATQGIQAQTLANLHLAQKENLVIIPVVNKIDLPSADIEKTEAELQSLLRFKKGEILRVSGKEGTGVEELLRAVVSRVPPSKAEGAELRALVFDSFFDPYQGVIACIRMVGGTIRRGDRVRFFATGAEVEALEVGIFLPERAKVDSIGAGEIGYLATGIKEPEKVRVGDTVVKAKVGSHISGAGEATPLTGYAEPSPMVYASIFPENQDDYETLREALKKLKLNDAAIVFEPEEGTGALGRGFRAGFLGMLHMEIASERLRREYGLRLVFSNPSVAFRVKTAKGTREIIYSASKMPGSQGIVSIEEPWARAEVISPARFMGELTSLIHEYKGTLGETETLSGERLLIRFQAPLRGIIIDFYDKLKSISQGFASMAYSLGGYRPADLVRLDILVAGEYVPALAEVVLREDAYRIARERVAKLKEFLPRELFSVALQAEVGGRVIARETIPALRKDVTGYLYGGDRTRKMKLWKKQQKGKKKLKEMGRVEIPPEIFLKMLKK